VGQRVLFASSAATVRTPTGTTQTGFYVTSTTISGNDVVITFAAAMGGTDITGTVLSTNVTVGDWICTAATETATNLDSGIKHEIMGIAGIFSDIGPIDGVGVSVAQQGGAYSVTATTSTLFQGVLCATNLWNQGIVLDNSGSGNRPLTEALLQQGVSDAERINNANITMLMSHPYTYDSYVALLVRDKRYQNTTKLEGGHTSLSFNGLDWVKDRHCYQNRVYFLALDGQIQICETSPLEPLQAGDVTVWERLQDTDKYWRGWVRDDQLIVSGIRNRCGAVLTELNA
jgi:hypothetical protein